jgi:hypothetical protein
MNFSLFGQHFGHSLESAFPLHPRLGDGAAGTFMTPASALRPTEAERLARPHFCGPLPAAKGNGHGHNKHNTRCV